MDCIAARAAWGTVRVTRSHPPGCSPRSIAAHRSRRPGRGGRVESTGTLAKVGSAHLKIGNTTASRCLPGRSLRKCLDGEHHSDVTARPAPASRQVRPSSHHATRGRSSSCFAICANPPGSTSELWITRSRPGVPFLRPGRRTCSRIPRDLTPVQTPVVRGQASAESVAPARARARAVSASGEARPKRAGSSAVSAWASSSIRCSDRVGLVHWHRECARAGEGPRLRW
jgi:hypothetical protein